MIRRDLFAVKVFQDVGKTKGEWVYERISRTRRTAQAHKQLVEGDHHRTFPLVAPKIVHPSQDTVNAFVLVGNEIVD